MTKISYAGYRFPPVIIQHAVWLYARFTLSLRDVEDLQAERGIMVSYDAGKAAILESSGETYTSLNADSVKMQPTRRIAVTD